MLVSPRTVFVKRSTSAWKGKSCFPVTAKVESGVGILWYIDFKEALDILGAVSFGNPRPIP